MKRQRQTSANKMSPSNNALFLDAVVEDKVSWCCDEVWKKIVVVVIIDMMKESCFAVREEYLIYPI